MHHIDLYAVTLFRTFILHPEELANRKLDRSAQGALVSSPSSRSANVPRKNEVSDKDSIERIEESDTTGRPETGGASLVPMRRPRRQEHLAIGSLSPSDILEGVRTDGFSPEQKDKLFQLRDAQLALPSRDRELLRTGKDMQSNGASEKELQQKAFRWLQAETMIRSAPLDQTLKFRLPMAWRILRMFLIYTGRGGSDMPLVECMAGDDDNSDPWKYPDHPKILRPRARKVPDRWTEALVRIDELDDKWKIQMRMADGRIAAATGLPYLPPPVPMGSRGPDGYPIRTYDPDAFERDPALHWYCEAIQAIIDHLDIGTGIRGNPELAEAAMFGLASPVLCRYAWPSPQQLIDFEEDFMEAIVETLSSGDGTTGSQSGGRRTVRKFLKESYGIGYEEATMICRMAEGRVVSEFDGDKERHRALMVHRLEDFIDRAKKSGDLSREIMGIGRLCSVLGIVKGFGEGSDDIMDDVRKVIEAQESGAMPEYGADVTFLPAKK